MRELVAQLGLDLLDDVVAVLHRPCAGDEDVQRDERAPARLAGAQRVEVDALVLAIVLEDRVDLRAVVAVERVEDDLRARLPHATIFTHLEPVEDPKSFSDIDLDRAMSSSPPRRP